MLEYLSNECLNQWFPNGCHLGRQGRNFYSWEDICSREALGRGKAVDEKAFNFYLFIQHIRTAQ